MNLPDTANGPAPATQAIPTRLGPYSKGPRKHEVFRNFESRGLAFARSDRSISIESI